MKKRRWISWIAAFSACAAGGVVEARQPAESKAAAAVVEGVVRGVFRDARDGRGGYLVQIEVRRSELGRAAVGGTTAEAPAPGRPVYVHAPQSGDDRRATPTTGSSVRAYLQPRERGGWEAASADWFEPSPEAAERTGANERRAPTVDDREAPRPGPADRDSVLAKMGLKTERVDAGGRLVFKVVAVAPDTAAQEAGIETGDAIIGANGEGFTDPDQVDALLRKEGDVARLAVLDVRTGKQAIVRTKVPLAEEAAPRPREKRSLGAKVQPRRVGFRVVLEVIELAPGGPAQSAGIEKGDVLVEAGGVKLTDEEQLQQAVDRSGATLTVTVRDVRTGKEVPVEVKLGGVDSTSPRPTGASPPRPKPETAPTAGGGPSSKSFGVATEAATVGLLPVVKIVSVARGSAAEKAGLKVGDAVTELNDRVVFAPDLFEEALGKAGSKFTLTLLDETTGEKTTLKIDLGR